MVLRRGRDDVSGGAGAERARRGGGDGAGRVHEVVVRAGVRGTHESTFPCLTRDRNVKRIQCRSASYPEEEAVEKAIFAADYQ